MMETILDRVVDGKSFWVAKTTFEEGTIVHTSIDGDISLQFIPTAGGEQPGGSSENPTDSVIEEVKEYLVYMSNKDKDPDNYEMFWKAKELLSKLEERKKPEPVPCGFCGAVPKVSDKV